MPEDLDQEPDLRPGTVSRLVRQQRNPERVSVFIDDAFAFGVHEDLVIEFGLYKGQPLDVATQQQIVEADSGRAAMQTALDYLGYRARTEREVRRKLAGRDFGEAVIERTVARLVELDYLDDAAYARSYIEARFRNRGYGPQRLRTDLMRRGVARTLIDAALEALVEDDDVLEAARTHAARRWPRLAAETDPRKRRRKLSDFLLRRGFSFDTIRRVVDELESDSQTAP